MIIQTRAIVLKKLKAKRLFVNRLYTAKEVALKVGVTEKTVAAWINANDWREQRDNVLNKIISNDNPPVIPEIIVMDFLEFVRETAPRLAKKVQPLANEYLQQSTNIS